MAKQGESRLQLRIRKALQRDVGGWWVKIWGGPFQQAGIPDLLGCVDGHFFAFEVKMPKGKTSDIQKQTIIALRRSGACAEVVKSSKEAVEYVAAHLQKAGPASKGSRKDRVGKPVARDVLRAGNREDMDDRGVDRARRERAAQLFSSARRRTTH